ncbi:hypothetical protein ACWIG4_30175 [Streptomyces sp. NPDC002248]
MAFMKNFLGQPQIGWIIGPEYSDCEKEFRVIYDSLKALGVDRLSPKFSNNVENGNMHIKTSWGFDLQCRSARHPESLVGEGLDFVLLVEGGRHRRKMWGDYVRPALSDKRGWSFTSGVPEGASENSLLYSLFQRGQDPTKKSWSSITMPSWTNDIVFPGGRYDPEILEARDDLTEDEFNRQYGAEFVDSVGRVMKEWDDEDHVKDLTYNPRWPLFAAVDFGYTNDWVWLWIQLDTFGNVYVIGEERYRLRDTDDIAVHELQDKSLTSKLSGIYVDPAAPDDAAILRRKLGKPTFNNTGGELKTRLNLIRTALKLRPEHLEPGHPDKKPRLLVDRSCVDLIREMGRDYRWPEKKSDTNNDSELPMDKDNHGPEALGRFFKGHMENITGARSARQSRVKSRMVGGGRR